MGKLFSALITLSLIWGTSFLFIKLLVTDLGPAGVVFGRCLFGAILLLAVLVFKRVRTNWSKLPFKMLILVAFFNNALPWYFISSSEQVISSSMASILNATTPFWTLLIGLLLFSSKMHKKQWIGVVIGFSGIYLLSEININDLFNENTTGLIFMLSAACCYGIGTHLTKKYLSSLSVVEISFFTLTFASIMALIYLLITSPKSLYAFNDIGVILSLIGLGAIGSGIAYLLFYYLVKEGGPEFASFVTYLVPISALMWGVFLLKEPVHYKMFVGLILILSGVYVSTRKPKTTSIQVNTTSA